jgi:hypothetical protein
VLHLQLQQQHLLPLLIRNTDSGSWVLKRSTMYTRVQGFASALDDLYCRGSACAPTGPGDDPSVAPLQRVTPIVTDADRLANRQVAAATSGTRRS